MSTTSCCTRALVSVASRLPMPPALETDCKEIGTRGLAMPWQSEARQLGGLWDLKSSSLWMQRHRHQDNTLTHHAVVIARS